MRDSKKGRWPWAAALVLIAVLGIRAPGIWTELWMDEILSIRLVEAVRSPLGVFTEIHSDNNHYLNSLWLWAVGSGAPGWLLRLPPLILGVALVGLAYRVTLPRGRDVAAVTAALFTFSYPLIHYSSEARGYGYLVFLTLLAYGAFRAWIENGGSRPRALYALFSSLALLAHLGFVTVFAALVFWSVLEITGSKENRAHAFVSHVRAHTMPAVILLALYLVDIRSMTAAGGFARIGAIESIAGAAGLVVGVAPGAVAAVVALCAWGAIGLGVRISYRDFRNETLFCVAAILLSFASGALPGYGYPRYYLTALLFLLLLLGIALAAGLRSERWKAVTIALLVMVCAVNLAQAFQFASVGRGMYREATALMAVETGFASVTVAGSHDRGSVLALGYYGAGLPGETRFTYFCHEMLRPPGARTSAPLASREIRYRGSIFWPVSKTISRPRRS